MAFVVTEAINQNKVADYMIKKLDTVLVSSGVMRHHNAGKGVDSFKIPGFDDGVTGDYDGSDITFNDQTMTSKPLVLDQKKYTAPQVDRIDNYENALEIVTGMVDRAVYAVAKVVDKFVFKTVADDVLVPTLPVYTVDVDTVINEILQIGLKMDENDIPEFGRELYVPPFVSTALAEANIVLNTGTAEDATRAGFVGYFGGFRILKSNNLASGTTPTYDALDEINIPKATPIVVGNHAGVSSGTAVYENGNLYVLNATDEAIAISANALVADSKIMFGSFQEGGDFAQSLQHSELINRESNFKTAYKSLTSYGAVLSNPKCYVNVEAIPA